MGDRTARTGQDRTGQGRGLNRCYYLLRLDLYCDNSDPERRELPGCPHLKSVDGDKHFFVSFSVGPARYGEAG